MDKNGRIISKRFRLFVMGILLPVALVVAILVATIMSQPSAAADGKDIYEELKEKLEYDTVLDELDVNGAPVTREVVGHVTDDDSEVRIVSEKIKDADGIIMLYTLDGEKWEYKICQGLRGEFTFTYKQLLDVEYYLFSFRHK